MRDMTKAAYERKVKAYGFGDITFFGYRPLPAPHQSTHVSEWNGGETYRGKLHYLLDQNRRTIAAALRTLKGDK